MKHDHSNHDIPDPEMELMLEEPVDPPMPTGGWEGQTLQLEPGLYQAAWEFKKKKNGKYKGCKIRTYRFTLTTDSKNSLDGVNGEFTIHSRKSGQSIRTQIDILIDRNGDGKYGDDEVMISSGKEGYRIRDAITDYTTREFNDAMDLRRIARSGKFSFEMSSSSYIPPSLDFKNFNQKQNDKFSINFVDYNYNDEIFVVC